MPSSRRRRRRLDAGLAWWPGACSCVVHCGGQSAAETSSGEQNGCSSGGYGGRWYARALPTLPPHPCAHCQQAGQCRAGRPTCTTPKSAARRSGSDRRDNRRRCVTMRSAARSQPAGGRWGITRRHRGGGQRARRRATAQPGDYHVAAGGGYVHVAHEPAGHVAGEPVAVAERRRGKADPFLEFLRKRNGPGRKSPAERYIDNVIRGKVPACRWVRLFASGTSGT